MTEASVSEECKVAIMVLIGLPASGKSTFVQQYKEYIQSKESNMKLAHICYDDLIPLETQKQTVTEPGLWKDLRTKVHQTVNLKLHQYMGQPCDLDSTQFCDTISFGNKDENDIGGESRLLVIIDDNNHLSSMRYPYFQMARDQEIGFCQLHLTTEVQTALRLNKERIHRVPDEVITRMSSTLEAPDPFKNSWEKFSFVIKYNEEIKYDFEILSSIIETAFKYPEKQIPDDSAAREQDRIICSANLIHQVDKHLRTVINKSMKTLKDRKTDGVTMKQKSAEYYSAKQEVVEDLKTGFTKLDRDLVDEVNSRNNDSSDKLFLVVQDLFNEKLKL